MVEGIGGGGKDELKKGEVITWEELAPAGDEVRNVMVAVLSVFSSTKKSCCTVFPDADKTTNLAPLLAQTLEVTHIPGTAAWAGVGPG